jgi:hypothetical protein
MAPHTINLQHLVGRIKDIARGRDKRVRFIAD